MKNTIKGFCAIVTALAIFILNTIFVGAVNVSEFILRTTETIGTTDEPLYSLVFREDDNGFVEQILDAIDSGFTMSDLNSFDYYIVVAGLTSGAGTSATYQLHVYAWDSELQPYIIAYGSGFRLFSSQVNAVDFHVAFDIDSNSEGGGWATDALGINDSYFYNPNYEINTNNYHYAIFPSSYYLLDANIPVYDFDEIEGHTGENNDYNYTWSTANSDVLTNIFPSSLAGYDAQGSVVSGGGSSPGVESNINHLYFKDVDIGFCSLRDASTSTLLNLGGSNLYIKYSYDNWVDEHISQYWVNVKFDVTQQPIGYDLYTYNGEFRNSANIDGFILKDLRSCASDSAWLERGIINVVYDDVRVKDNYVQNYLYGFPIHSFIENRGRYLHSGRGSRAFGVGSNSGQLAIEDLTSALTSTLENASYSRFLIRVTVNLVDAETGEKSGDFVKQFNLINGVSSVEDNSGLKNPNPYNPPSNVDDPSENALVPDNNQFPSLITQNNITINADGTLSYDIAYDEVKKDVESVNPGDMGSYLAPIKDEGVSDFIWSYIDGMPTVLKTTFVGGAGILVFLGIYRFIRRG